MEWFRELETQLCDLGCPLCSSPSFKVTRGTETGTGHANASCSQCGSVFGIDKGPVSHRLPTGIRRKLNRYGCIFCGSHLTRVAFRCEIDSYTHFFVALCRDCSKAFALTGGRPSPFAGIPARREV